MGLTQFTNRHPITILRPVQVADSYNNQLDDWDNASPTETMGWLVQTGAQEVLGNRDAQVTDAVLYLTAEKDIAEHDRVLFGQAIYEVVGRPNYAPTPRGIHHVEAKLREVTG